MFTVSSVDILSKIRSHCVKAVMNSIITRWPIRRLICFMLSSIVFWLCRNLFIQRKYDTSTSILRQSRPQKVTNCFCGVPFFGKILNACEIYDAIYLVCVFFGVSYRLVCLKILSDQSNDYSDNKCQTTNFFLYNYVITKKISLIYIYLRYWQERDPCTLFAGITF